MPIISLILLLIVIAGAIGILFVVLKQTGINIPAWLVSILWIVLAVCVGVVAVKFIASLL